MFHHRLKRPLRCAFDACVELLVEEAAALTPMTFPQAARGFRPQTPLCNRAVLRGGRCGRGSVALSGLRSGVAAGAETANMLAKAVRSC